MDLCYNTGYSRKNGTEFAVSHFCNHKSQNHAAFNKMSRNKLLTWQRPTFECSSWILFVLQLTSELFENKINHSFFSWVKQHSCQKSVSRIKEKRCSMCPPRERTTNNSRLDHCSIAPSIIAVDWSCPSNCSGLASDDQRPQSSDYIPAAAEPPQIE